jgi:hypothetical protein
LAQKNTVVADIWIEDFEFSWIFMLKSDP